MDTPETTITTTPTVDGSDPGSRPHFEIGFPRATGATQDEECCDVVIDGSVRRFRFHDYDEIYSVPGLYEQLFYDELECKSPKMVRELLIETMEDQSLRAEELRVLDVGAGNGMVGEQLAGAGVRTIIGADIIAEAKMAVERDRPGVYDDYHVVDLTAIEDSADEALSAADLNCMTTVAALGFGDIPPEAFAGAYGYIADGGLIAFSIRSDFLDGGDDSGFSLLIKSALERGSLQILGRKNFVHRLSAIGEPITYDAIVARKQGDLPGFPS